jgi:serpin B
MRPLFNLVCFGLFAVTVSPGRAAEAPEVEPLIKGNTAFAMELYARLRDNQGNIVFSPYSVSSAMAMTYGGARGETARQIEQALRLPSGGTNVHGLFKLLDAALTNGGVALEIGRRIDVEMGSLFALSKLT